MRQALAWRQKFRTMFKSFSIAILRTWRLVRCQVFLDSHPTQHSIGRSPKLRAIDLRLRTKLTRCRRLSGFSIRSYRKIDSNRSSRYEYRTRCNTSEGVLIHTASIVRTMRATQGHCTPKKSLPCNCKVHLIGGSFFCVHFFVT